MLCCLLPSALTAACLLLALHLPSTCPPPARPQAKCRAARVDHNTLPPVSLQAKYRVKVPCGDDARLYSSPLIKFTKACAQLTSGNSWYLSGEQPGCCALKEK